MIDPTILLDMSAAGAISSNLSARILQNVPASSSL
jgi:hypothetical protein